MTKQGKAFAAGAALAFFVAWHAGPASASSNTPVVSDDVTESATALDTLSPPTHSLAPRIEAAFRKVFKEPATSLADGNGKPLGSQRPAITTRVPGISDEQLARYRRQMYRKDI
jgi:hypothetical protein